MAFWIPMAAMAGAQLLQQQEQQEQARAQNKVAATQTEFMPFTGQGPGQIQHAPSAWTAMAKGAAQGASMGQAYDQYKSAQDMQNQQKLGQTLDSGQPIYNQQQMVQDTQKKPWYAMQQQSSRGQA